jgi:azurin
MSTQISAVCKKVLTNVSSNVKQLSVIALVLASVGPFGDAAFAASASQKAGSGLQVATKGDDLAFDKATLTAKPGQTVKITFTNKSSKNSGMQHNWVLVNPGTADTVGQASMMAGADKGYIALSPDVIAHTKLLSAGESDTIEFKAPAKAGDYPYICTFPGHYTMMKGVLKVK